MCFENISKMKLDKEKLELTENFQIQKGVYLVNSLKEVYIICFRNISIIVVERRFKYNI